jgi:hypothetical protein
MSPAAVATAAVSVVADCTELCQNDAPSMASDAPDNVLNKTTVRRIYMGTNLSRPRSSINTGDWMKKNHIVAPMTNEDARRSAASTARFILTPHVAQTSQLTMAD